MKMIYLGYDQREGEAFAVARFSIERRLTLPVPIYALVQQRLRHSGLYTREHYEQNGQLYDAISEAPMSTEFSLTRFLVPLLSQTGLALFADCDVLAKDNLLRLFDQYEKDKAVMVVKHNHQPAAQTKMDGQIQTNYNRKNWSSVMLFNCDHPSNRKLDLKTVNTAPGRDLHNFCWLEDHEIGELDPGWNFLVGHTPKEVTPRLLHFTEGGPWFKGYQTVDYAGEWYGERDMFLRAL